MTKQTLDPERSDVHALTAGAARRVLLADDHEMVRMAMRAALAGLGRDIEWLEAEDAASAEACLARLPSPDLALVDLSMPGSEGAAWIARILRAWPAVRVVVLSADEDPSVVRELVSLGVAGYIPKSDRTEVILQAVRLVLAGGTYAPLRLMEGSAPPSERNVALTPRQRAVLECLARGMPNKLIARELNLTEGTVKVHLMAIFRALEVRNRTEAVIAAQRQLQRHKPSA